MNDLIRMNPVELYRSRKEPLPEGTLSFIQILRETLKGVGAIELTRGLDREYLRLFKALLKGRRSMEWSVVESLLGINRDNPFSELPLFVYRYLPVFSGGTGPDVEFVPLRSGDVSLGELTTEEKDLFGNAIEVASEVLGIAVSYKGGSVSGDNCRSWVSGLKPVAYTYWILFWCSVAWRLDETLKKMASGYELEIRKGWQLVASYSSTKIPLLR